MSSEYIKDFDGWHPVKKRIDLEARVPTIRQREIWWCSTGVNVGIEQDGKNDLYERPVLVVRKFNRRHFLGVPLSSQLKDFPHFHSVHYKGPSDREAKERKAILSQIRSYDSVRLTRFVARLGSKQFDELMRELHAMLDT